MTAEDVKSKIDAIRRNERDYETAHGDEDNLLWEFVKYIAADWATDNAKDIAMLLLEWQEESASHPRYCA